MTLWWIGDIVLIVVVAPIVVLLLHGVLTEARGIVPSVRRIGAAAAAGSKDLDAVPLLLTTQDQVIKTVELLEERLAHITTPMTLSVIGCVVNGPGEARETDIGFTGGGNNTHQIYLSGAQAHRLKDQSIVDHLVELVEKKAAEIEAAKAAEAAAAAAAE